MGGGTNQAGEFLVGVALAKRIIGAAKGGQVRCAVAFWSAVGVGEIFPTGVPKDAKIVCDISMGATSAEALSALQAPHNPNLRHSVRMHAKVFISDKGLVVGSANASASALGDCEGPNCNTEAGVFHSPGSPSWQSAVAWFDNFLNESLQIGDTEVEWARLTYRPKPLMVRPGPVASGSLLDLVTAASWRFSKVGFVFTSTSCTDEQKAEVRKRVNESGKYDSDRISKLHDDETFFGWDRKDITRWPEFFFSFWQPKSHLYVYGNRMEARVPKIGSLMTSKDWRGLRKFCDVDLPSAQDINKADAEMALKLRGGNHGVFYANGEELAARIGRIKTENN